MAEKIADWDTARLQQFIQAQIRQTPDAMTDKKPKYSTVIEAFGGLDMPTGSIISWGGAPRQSDIAAGMDPPGWLICDGRTFKKADYPRLAMVLATAVWDEFGTPPAADSFKIPDLSGRFLQGQSFWQSGGAGAGAAEPGAEPTLYFVNVTSGTTGAVPIPSGYVTFFIKT